MSQSVRGEILAEVTRSGLVESHHSGHAIIISPDGSTLLSRGDTSLAIFPRSAIKSMQASGMVRAGLDLEPRLLALVCSSHSGDEIHREGARQILALAGLDESALRNTKDRPIGEESRIAWGAAPATSLAHNCSGKHSGMLLTCVTNNWSTEDYLDPNHPLQLACRKELEDLSGEEVSLTSIDGCGAPLFVMTLAGVARATHNLTVSKDPVHQRVVQACRDFPEMVAGEGRLTTRMMREVPGLFMKEGAEGVEIGSLADGGSFVFKMNDGSGRAFGPLTVAALKELGLDVPAQEVLVYGGAEVMGSIRATI